MNTSLSIFHKGVVLVAIPLTTQLLFLTVLLVARANQQEAQRWALDSKETMTLAETIHRGVVEAQTHTHLLVLTGVAQFSQRYQEPRTQVPAQLSALAERVKEYPEQLARVRDLQGQTREYLGWLDDNVRLLQEKKRLEVEIRIQTLEGTSRLEAVRAVLDEFRRAEENVLARRQADLDRATSIQHGVMLGGGLLALLTSAALLLLFGKGISTRLAILTENTRRMAEGKELAPRLRGHDELAQLDGMFHAMSETIRQKDQENEMFVYSVSHDLRSPLVNLQGFSQELATAMKELRPLIQQEVANVSRRAQALQLLDRDVAEAIQFIQSAVTRLAGIIDALLRLSRAGRVEYRWQDVDVQLTVDRVVRALHGSLSHSGAVVTVESLAPCRGDPLAVEQIFANLLSNAVSYLDPKRPGRIEVGMAEAGESEKGLNVYQIRDNGLGIAENLQGKVFVAFQRLHPEVGPGEGVGLALVRRVVERHGGKIWLESRPNVGTTFYVALPPASAPLPEPRSPGSPQSQPVTQS